MMTGLKREANEGEERRKRADHIMMQKNEE
jgi:hypothetical protein